MSNCSARKLAAASSTPASTRPTRGTIHDERSRMRESTARNSAVPSSAATAEIPILAITGQCGTQRNAASMPRLADSTVPTVEGSTKWLRASICMSSPQTAMDAPASNRARVRGTRL